MTLTNLEEIKEFLLREVTPTIKLLQSTEDDAVYKLVEPAVHVGWIPDNGFLPDDAVSIPCLVVGMEQSDMDEDDGSLSVVVTVAVCRYGLTNNTGALTDGLEGYKDLINLLDRTAAAVLRKRLLAPNLKLTSPVRQSMYKDQPYPYWYGKIMFTVSTDGYPCVAHDMNF